jgi:hypothetical protein
VLGSSVPFFDINATGESPYLPLAPNIFLHTCNSDTNYIYNDSRDTGPRRPFPDFSVDHLANIFSTFYDMFPHPPTPQPGETKTCCAKFVCVPFQEATPPKILNNSYEVAPSVPVATTPEISPAEIQQQQRWRSPSPAAVLAAAPATSVPAPALATQLDQPLAAGRQSPMPPAASEPLPPVTNAAGDELMATPRKKSAPGGGGRPPIPAKPQSSPLPKSRATSAATEQPTVEPPAVMLPSFPVLSGGEPVSLPPTQVSDASERWRI